MKKVIINSETGEIQEIQLTTQEEQEFLDSQEPAPPQNNYITDNASFSDVQGVYFVDSDSGDIVISLPDPEGRLNQEATFIKTSPDNVMKLSGKIQGQNSVSITDTGSITIISDNSIWWIK